MLLIEGAGFWPSEDITVRFIPVPGDDGEMPDVPVRAAVGQFMKEGLIKCRTPKVAVACRVKVEVALNAKSFTNNSMMFSYYPVPELLACAPSFIPASGGTELVIASSNTVRLWECEQLRVRFKEVDPATGREVKGGRVAEVPATIQSIEHNNAEGRDEGDNDNNNNNNNNNADDSYFDDDGLEYDEFGNPLPAQELEASFSQQLICDSPSFDEVEGGAAMPLHADVSVSFNGQDFFPLQQQPSVTFHAAAVQDLSPAVANVAGGSAITLKGKSFFESDTIIAIFTFTPTPPPSRPKAGDGENALEGIDGSEEAAAGAGASSCGEAEDEDEDEEAAYSLKPVEMRVPVKYVSSTELTLVAPSLDGRNVNATDQQVGATGGVDGEVEAPGAEGNEDEALAAGEEAEVERIVINGGRPCPASIRVSFDDGATFVGGEVNLQYYEPGPLSIEPPLGPISGGTTVVLKSDWLVPSPKPMAVLFRTPAQAPLTHPSANDDDDAPSNVDANADVKTPGAQVQAGGGAGEQGEAFSSLVDACCVRVGTTSATVPSANDQGGEGTVDEIGAAGGALSDGVDGVTPLDQGQSTSARAEDASANAEGVGDGTSGAGAGADGSDAKVKVADESKESLAVTCVTPALALSPGAAASGGAGGGSSEGGGDGVAGEAGDVEGDGTAEGGIDAGDEDGEGGDTNGTEGGAEDGGADVAVTRRIPVEVFLSPDGTTPGVEPATLAEFTFYEDPLLSALEPPSGPALSQVQLTGSHLWDSGFLQVKVEVSGPSATAAATTVGASEAGAGGVEVTEDNDDASGAPADSESSSASDAIDADAREIPYKQVVVVPAAIDEEGEGGEVSVTFEMPALQMPPAMIEANELLQNDPDAANTLSAPVYDVLVSLSLNGQQYSNSLPFEYSWE